MTAWRTFDLKLRVFPALTPRPTPSATTRNGHQYAHSPARREQADCGASRKTGRDPGAGRRRVFERLQAGPPRGRTGREVRQADERGTRAQAIQVSVGGR